MNIEAMYHLLWCDGIYLGTHELHGTRWPQFYKKYCVTWHSIPCF